MGLSRVSNGGDCEDILRRLGVDIDEGGGLVKTGAEDRGLDPRMFAGIGGCGITIGFVEDGEGGEEGGV